MRTEISNEIVRLHREQFGRGPERARTILGGDLVTCVLEGVLTSPEATLMLGGQSASVADSRVLLQKVGAPQVVAAIERVTGRRVKEFISGINPDNGGTAVEVFVLEPAAEDAGEPEVATSGTTAP